MHALLHAGPLTAGRTVARRLAKTERLMSTCPRRQLHRANVLVWKLPFMNAPPSWFRLALACVLYACILFLVDPRLVLVELVEFAAVRGSSGSSTLGPVFAFCLQQQGSLMILLKVVNMGAAAYRRRRREDAWRRLALLRHRQHQRQRQRQERQRQERQRQRACAPPAPPPVPPPAPPLARPLPPLPPASPSVPPPAPLQSSPLADVLICVDLGQVVFDHLDLRDLSTCDATCTALAACTDARWRELVEKRWPKSIAWAQQVVEGMGYRNFFLWRARNRRQHSNEAFRLALNGDAAGLRQMLQAGKPVNGPPSQSPPPPFGTFPTVVHAAVWVRATEAVQVLLEADGVDLSAHSCMGITPLHYAASRCGSDMCKLLVENGANHEIYASTRYSHKRKHCRLVGCLHLDEISYDANGSIQRIKRCGGMPIDNARRGEAKDYLESLSYSRRRRGQVGEPNTDFPAVPL